MELYKAVSYELATHLTGRYSTSFSMSSRLFAREMKPHIYAIYGMVRLADEIVDSYQGNDVDEQLALFVADVERATRQGYSTNPVLHAYALTARQYGIDASLTDPFFSSMRMDLASEKLDNEKYRQYIYGSAEVVGLMCLRVFVDGDEKQFARLAPGARALGAAYQKINFLRDIADDYTRLGRVYFPGVDFATFSDEQKKSVETDIQNDLSAADESVAQLPVGAKAAVWVSYKYYSRLFHKLQRATVKDVKAKRLRVSNVYKIALFLYGAVKR